VCNKKPTNFSQLRQYIEEVFYDLEITGFCKMVMAIIKERLQLCVIAEGGCVCKIVRK
jgi:hypothetical protein